MKAELGSTSTAGHALRGGFDLVPEHVMSLSVASSATSYGKPLRNDLAGLSTLAAPGADAPQRPSVAPSWSWTPTSTGSGQRDAQVASLMAALTQFRASDSDDLSASSSGTGAAQDGATGPRIALNDGSAMSTAQAASVPTDSAQQLDWLQSQGLPQAMPSNGIVVPSSGPSTENQSSSDDAAAVAELKLEALFKTLQAYGL